jgi:hypothetical protein
MGVLTDLVVADESEAPAVGGSSVPWHTWLGIDAKGIDHVKLAKLMSILLGLPYQNSFAAEFAQLHEQSEDGPWVFKVPTRLVAALATLDEHRVTQVAIEWSKIQEFALDRWPTSAVDEVLKRISSLAKKAASQKKSLLIWMSL